MHLIHHFFFLRVIVTEQLFNRMSDNHISYPCRYNKWSLHLMPDAAHTHYLTVSLELASVCGLAEPSGQALCCWQDSGPHRLLDWGPQFLPDWRPEAALLHKAAYNIPKSKLARELKRPNKTEARIFGNQILEGTSRFYPLKRVTGSNPHLKVGNYGIPLSHKKEWNNAICRNRDRPRD